LTLVEVLAGSRRRRLGVRLRLEGSGTAVAEAVVEVVEAAVVLVVDPAFVVVVVEVVVFDDEPRVIR